MNAITEYSKEDTVFEIIIFTSTEIDKTLWSGDLHMHNINAISDLIIWSSVIDSINYMDTKNFDNTYSQHLISLCEPNEIKIKNKDETPLYNFEPIINSNIISICETELIDHAFNMCHANSSYIDNQKDQMCKLIHLNKPMGKLNKDLAHNDHGLLANNIKVKPESESYDNNNGNGFRLVLATTAIVSLSLITSPKIILAAAVAIVAMEGCQYMAEMDGILGHIGGFCDKKDMIIRFFSITTSLTISSDYKKGYPGNAMLVTTLATVVMSPISIAVSELQYQIHEWLSGQQTFTDIYNMHINTYGEKENEEMTTYVKFILKNGVGRFVKENIKSFTGSSILSEGGANVLKGITFDNRAFVDWKAHRITFVNALFKCLSKNVVREVGGNDYIIVVIGTLFANIADEIQNNEYDS